MKTKDLIVGLIVFLVGVGLMSFSVFVEKDPVFIVYPSGFISFIAGLGILIYSVKKGG